MRKSLFAKYFTVFSVIILTSFVFLGAVFSILISQYLKNERQDMLMQNVSKAANYTVYNYRQNGGRFIDPVAVRQFYISISDISNGVMFLTDVNGNTLICTEDGLCSHETSKAPKFIIDSMKEGKVFDEYGKFGNTYSSVYYTIGCPVITNGGTKTIGYLFCSTPADTFSDLIADIGKLFLTSAFFAILLSSVVIYVITSFLSKPLKEMSKAAKSFGKGDFSARVNYKSDDEIGELADSFNQMADSLSELESTRKNFIANVSHELKTPMTTIGGFIDGILDGTIESGRQDYYLTLVSDEIKRLSRLVRAMLNVAKIEAGETKLNVTPINISDIIITTLFNFEKNIDDKKLGIKGLAEMDKMIVQGDEDLIHQVVYNLIDNAVKFCNQNGYLEFFVDKDDEFGYVHIKNSGSGISREEINHIFDRFYKTDKSRGLDKNGVGLGLHIVRSIVDMHNGTITVGSVEGEYTEFIVGLPLIENVEKRRFIKKS